MPFILIVVGIILLVTAIQGTTSQLGAMLAQDSFGQGGFIYWFVAILVIGALGYYKPARPLSDAFLFLVILVLFLSHKGFFQQFNAAIAAIKPGGTSTGVGTTTQGFGGPQGAGVPSALPGLQKLYGPGVLFPQGQENNPNAVPSYIPGVY